MRWSASWRRGCRGLAPQPFRKDPTVEEVGTDPQCSRSACPEHPDRDDEVPDRRGGSRGFVVSQVRLALLPLPEFGLLTFECVGPCAVGYPPTTQVEPMVVVIPANVALEL